MTNAAIYARLSTQDRKDGAKIKDQIRECSEHAETNGLSVVAQFPDDGVSGFKVSRPGLNAALEAAERGDFEILIVRSHGRLARDATLAGMLQNQFENAGILIHYTQMGGPVDRESTAGVWLDGMMKLKAEAERVDIRDRTMKGRYRRAAEGKIMVGGLTIFGYKRIRHNADKPKEAFTSLEVVKSEAKVVRRMFKWFLKGQTYTEIADRLNDAGIDRYNPKYREAVVRNGKVVSGEWEGRHIKDVLTHIQYTGVRYYGIQKSKALRGEDQVRRWFVSHDDPSVVKQEVEPIIDNDTFAQAQARIKSLNRQNSRKKPAGEYLLRSRITCAQCGGAYYCKTYTKPPGKKDKTRKQLFRYRHTETAEHADCPNKSRMLHRDPVDDLIRSELKGRFEMSEAELEEWISKAIEEELSDTEADRLQAQEINQELVRLEQKDSELNQMMIDEDLKVEDYNSLKAEIVGRVSKLTTTLEGLSVSDDYAEEIVGLEQSLRRAYQFMIEDDVGKDWFATVDNVDLTLRIVEPSDNEIGAKIELLSNDRELKLINGE